MLFSSAVCVTLLCFMGMSSALTPQVLSVSPKLPSMGLKAGFFDFMTPRSSAMKQTKIDVEEVKVNMISLAHGTQNGVKASKETRVAMAELVAQLERANPTKKLTSSTLIDGDWKLLFTTNDGSSAGKVGPFMGTVTQEVDLSSSYYDNVVTLGPLRGRLSATWNVESSTVWTVEFQTLVLSLFNVPIKSQKLSAVGTWRMTFLDDDMRVLYAQGGKNVKKENMYVLTRMG
jgi:hypothetical protein